MKIKVATSLKYTFLAVLATGAFLCLYLDNCPGIAKRMRLIQQMAGGECAYVLQERSFRNGAICQEGDIDSTDTKADLKARCIQDAYYCVMEPANFLGKRCEVNGDFSKTECAEIFSLLKNKNEIIIKNERGEAYNSKIGLLALLEDFVDESQVEEGLLELLQDGSSSEVKRAILFILSAKDQNFSSETIQAMMTLSKSNDPDIRKAALLPLVAINSAESIAMVKQLLTEEDPKERMRLALAGSFRVRSPERFKIHGFPEHYMDISFGRGRVENYKDEIIGFNLLTADSKLWSERLLATKTKKEAEDVYNARHALFQLTIHLYYRLDLKRDYNQNPWSEWTSEWNSLYPRHAASLSAESSSDTDKENK